MCKVMLKVKAVTKFLNKKCVLDDVSCEFEEGKIYGIIGRNGAGKTVLMKVICGFILPDKGSVYRESDEIGIIIETPGFLGAFSGYNNLQFLASIQKKINKEQIIDALKLVGLEGAIHQRVDTYSLGMRQRLGIAQAIMENQKIIILDEPMNGLDDRGVMEIRAVLHQLKQKGCTIIIATHNKEDISVLCNTVIQMDHGRIVAINNRDAD